jgi:hypothetical protein
MRCCKYFVVASLLIFVLAHTAAAQSSPLPLNLGNTWKLRSSANAEMLLTVVEQTSRGARVRWQNPWLPHLEFYFAPSANQVLVSAMNLGDYFDFAAAVNKTWTNVLGTFTVVSKTVTVITPVGTYTNCLHIRLRTPEGTAFDWILAPEVGFVQFGVGASAYVLAVKPTLVPPISDPMPPPAPQVPRAKGARILGLDVNTPADGNYTNAIALAKRVGVQTVSLTIHWEDIEIAPGVYRPQENLLAIANAFYPAQGLRVDLFIITRDPVGKHVPTDLQTLPMNDARVITRFQQFVNYVFTQIPHLHCNFLVIGSEIDIGLGTNATEWNQYEAFVRAARSHIVQRRPGLQVGVSATFQALTGVHRPQLQRMNPDEIFVSYYPLKSTFAVHQPTVVAADFAKLVSLYPGKSISIEQIGYPSSPEVDSSEAKQRDFYSEVFKAWDTYAAVIRSITFTWLTDLPASHAEDFAAYYGISSPQFRAMLSTLGLRTYPGSGADKAAFIALQAEAKKRGW